MDFTRLDTTSLIGHDKCMAAAHKICRTQVRGRKSDVIRIQTGAASNLISQVDFLHVMLNVWEGLDDTDKRTAIQAAGEKRAVRYRAMDNNSHTPLDSQGHQPPYPGPAVILGQGTSATHWPPEPRDTHGTGPHQDG